MMKNVTVQKPPSSLQAVAIVTGMVGLAYALVPIFALRPDGVLKEYPELWVDAIKSTLLGLSIIGVSVLVIRKYKSVTLALWWALLIIAILYGPRVFCMALPSHYFHK